MPTTTNLATGYATATYSIAWNLAAATTGDTAIDSLTTSRQRTGTYTINYCYICHICNTDGKSSSYTGTKASITVPGWKQWVFGYYPTHSFLQHYEVPASQWTFQPSGCSADTFAMYESDCTTAVPNCATATAGSFDVC